MPILQPCSSPGCPALVVSGKCDEHKAEYNRTRKKPAEKSKQYDWQWRRLRAWHIKREPLCRVCLGDGRIVAADEVHHVVAIHVDPSRRLDPTNLMSLCTPCHDAQHARQQVQTYMDDDQVGG